MGQGGAAPLHPVHRRIFWGFTLLGGVASAVYTLPTWLTDEGVRFSILAFDAAVGWLAGFIVSLPVQAAVGVARGVARFARALRSAVFSEDR